MSQKLTGKVAIVTGASKGIGAAIALRLAKDGASVVVNYSSSPEGAQKVVAQITAAAGKAIAAKANLSDPQGAKSLVDQAVKAFGRVDILVNNAGVYEFAPLEAITPEHYHKQFNLNVLGLLLATQAAVAAFPKEGGSVINISSVVTSAAPPASAVYTGTKGAVDAITKTLANELGPRKIRVNAVSPGLVATEGTHTTGITGSDFQKAFETQAPLGRIGQPDDIAPAVAYLASPDASWVTGQILNIAGGYK